LLALLLALFSASLVAKGSLASSDNNNPNGTWTLFFADSSAGHTSTQEGWSLDITAVPEPVNVALAIFGGVLAIWSGLRWRQQHFAGHQ
jgi:hypothetical protein